MVIFHSYVSLPEGKSLGNPQSSPWRVSLETKSAGQPVGRKLKDALIEAFSVTIAYSGWMFKSFESHPKRSACMVGGFRG